MSNTNITPPDFSNQFNRPFSVFLKEFSLRQRLVLLFLFAMSLNVGNYFNYCPYLALIPFLLLYRHHIRFPNLLIPTFFFSLSLFFFSPGARTSLNDMMRPFIFFLCAFLGYNLIEKRSSVRSEKSFILLVILLAFGCFLRYFLNFITNLGSSGDRNGMDIWTKSIISATGQAAMACPMIGICIAILLSKAMSKVKFYSCVTLLIIFSYNLILAGRTVFALAAIVTLAGLVYLFYTERRLTVSLSLLLGICAVVLVIFVVFSLNIFGIRETYLNSNFYARFWGEKAYISINEDNRLYFKGLYLQHVLKYPFGGNHIRRIVGAYAHDIYLDTYDESGVFAFAFLVLMIVDSIIKVYKICKRSISSPFLKLFLICVFTSLLAQFFSEPVLQGMPWLFAVYCTFYGALGSLNKIQSCG